jgi:hypothetical protein
MSCLLPSTDDAGMQPDPIRRGGVTGASRHEVAALLGGRRDRPHFHGRGYGAKRRAIQCVFAVVCPAAAGRENLHDTLVPGWSVSGMPSAGRRRTCRVSGRGESTHRGRSTPTARRSAGFQVPFCVFNYSYSFQRPVSLRLAAGVRLASDPSPPLPKPAGTTAGRARGQGQPADQ